MLGFYAQDAYTLISRVGENWMNSQMKSPLTCFFSLIPGLMVKNNLLLTWEDSYIRNLHHGHRKGIHKVFIEAIIPVTWDIHRPLRAGVLLPQNWPSNFHAALIFIELFTFPMFPACCKSLWMQNLHVQKGLTQVAEHFAWLKRL